MRTAGRTCTAAPSRHRDVPSACVLIGAIRARKRLTLFAVLATGASLPVLFSILFPDELGLVLLPALLHVGAAVVSSWRLVRAWPRPVPATEVGRNL